MKKGLVTLIVSAALLGAGATAPAADAHNGGGHATPANSYLGGHWWSYDGCSKIWDWPFLHACIHHDGCYRQHWASKLQCDWWFLGDMRATCRVIPLSLFQRGVCYYAAWEYFQFAVAFGRN